MLPARHFPVLLCVLVLFFPAFSFSDGVPEPTATPEPLRIPAQVSEPPEVIQAMIGTARAEWEKVGGKALPKSNKYTQWVNDAEWGWCGPKEKRILSFPVPPSVRESCFAPSSICTGPP